jgi:hypothetical protein
LILVDDERDTRFGFKAIRLASTFHRGELCSPSYCSPNGPGFSVESEKYRIHSTCHGFDLQTQKKRVLQLSNEKLDFGKRKLKVEAAFDLNIRLVDHELNEPRGF